MRAQWGYYSDPLHTVISRGNNNWAALRQVVHVVPLGGTSDQDNASAPICMTGQLGTTPSRGWQTWSKNFGRIRRSDESDSANAQMLESENTRLKDQSSRSTRAIPTSNHPRRQGTPKVRSAPPPTVEEPPEDDDGRETAQFGSPPRLEENIFESIFRENAQDPGPIAAEDTYEQSFRSLTVFFSLKSIISRLQLLKGQCVASNDCTRKRQDQGY